MADVLAMSERAGSLARELGGYLGAFGSTPVMKQLGSSIVNTADSLVAEVRRRTRKASAPAASASARGVVPVIFPQVPRVGATYSNSGRLITKSAATGSAVAAAAAAPAASAAGSALRSTIRGRPSAAADPASILTRTIRGPLPRVTGPAPPSESPANIARKAQNAALNAAAEQVKAAAKPSGLFGSVAKAVGLKPADAPSPFAPRRPLSSLPEEEAEENADANMEEPSGSPAAAASRMAGLFNAAGTLPGAAATLNAAKALVKGQKGGKRRRTRRNRKGL